MLLAGDEFGRSQNGNNNAYAQGQQDHLAQLARIDARGRSLREFTRKLIATRKAFPILYRGRFVVGTLNEELDVKDVTWRSPTGEEMATEQWEDGNARCFGMLLDGRAQESGVKRRGSDATLLLIYNAHHDVVNFTLPSVPEGRHWQGLIDTNRPDSQIAAFDFGDGDVVHVTQAVKTAVTEPPKAVEAQGNAEAAKLIARASALLGQGRYRCCADQCSSAPARAGNAKASFMLAETYDPAILTAWGTYGTRSEVTKARELYAKAHAGGIQEAEYRLNALHQ